MGVMPAIVGLVVVWLFLAAVGLVYAEAAAARAQSKREICLDPQGK